MSYYSTSFAIGNPLIFNPIDAIGGWKELARTTLGSPGDTIDVSSLADKRYYMILNSALTASGGSIQHLFRLGSTTIDTGSNYAIRISQSGGADTIGTSQSTIPAGANIENDSDGFSVNYLANLSAKEKLWLGQYVNRSTVGDGTAPLRGEVSSKWVNTSNPVDIMQLINAEAGSYNTGSEVVVLGWDPADIHTDNFWEELASVTLSGTDSNVQLSITSKKNIFGFKHT